MLHEQLKAARKTSGLTQAQLAAKAGVTARTIVKLEQGGNVNLHVLSAVANALGGRLVWRTNNAT